MDLKTLNKEILLCRAAVRRARVAVIRKLIKKIKVLKSCKKEELKEKRIRKADRLFQRVQIMKKAKEDEVTRFALRNADLEIYIKGAKIDIRQSALARLAQHEAVLKKVNAIREKIPDWEVELPQLLNSLGKKNKMQKKLGKGEVKKKKINKQQIGVSSVPKRTKPERQKQKLVKENEVLNDFKINKIDDPFFMGKKVIAPKFLDSTEESKSKKVEMKKDSFSKINRDLIFNTKHVKTKEDFVPGHKIEKHLPKAEEKLHPSWVAKKVKLIKPFEGKKIKFSDE